MKNQETCYIEKLAQKYSDSLKGYQLVKYFEAAFPAYRLNLELVVQKNKPLGKINEFCLKYIDAGVKKSKYLTNFLGLKEHIINSHIIDLYQKDLISLDLKNGESISITEKGKNALNESGLITPDNVNYMCIIDGLSGEVRTNEYLNKADYIKRLGIHMIPRYIKKPCIEDLELNKINDVIKKQQKLKYRDFLDGSIVNINKIENIYLEYTIMNVLVFVDKHGNLELQVYDRNQRVNNYEHILLKMLDEKYDVLQLDFKIDDIDSKEDNEFTLPPEIIKEAIDSEELIDKIEDEIKVLTNEVTEKEKELDADDEDYLSKTQIIKYQKEELEFLKAELSSKPRMLSTYDHRPMMFEALKNAKDQLIIVSPWIRTDVIDDEFRKLLKSTLIRGVKVIICYGISDKRESDTEYAIKLLRYIQTGCKNGNNLSLIKLGNTHEKVLVCDDKFMINTSFNWLSFKGDPNRGFRQETGIYLEDKGCIRDMFNDLENRIKKVDKKLSINKFNL